MISHGRAVWRLVFRSSTTSTCFFSSSGYLHGSIVRIKVLHDRVENFLYTDCKSKMQNLKIYRGVGNSCPNVPRWYMRVPIKSISKHLECNTTSEILLRLSFAPNFALFCFLFSCTLHNSCWCRVSNHNEWGNEFVNFWKNVYTIFSDNYAEMTKPDRDYFFSSTLNVWPDMWKPNIMAQYRFFSIKHWNTLGNSVHDQFLVNELSGQQLKPGYHLIPPSKKSSKIIVWSKEL